MQATYLAPIMERIPPPIPPPTPEQQPLSLTLSQKIHAASELMSMGLGLLNQVRGQLQAAGVIQPPEPIQVQAPPMSVVPVPDLSPDRFKDRILQQMEMESVKTPPPSQAPDNPEMAPKLIGRVMSVVNEPGEYPKMKTDVLCNCKEGWYILQEPNIAQGVPFRYGMGGEPGHALVLDTMRWLTCPVATGLVRLEDGFGAQQVRYIQRIELDNSGINAFWHIHISKVIRETA